MKAQASARVDVPTPRHFFVVPTKEPNTSVHVFFYDDAWICAGPTTDGDLESQRHERVNAWILARPTTDHDLVSVIPDKKEKSRAVQ